MSLGAGLSKVKGKVFRIGHLGHFNELMLMGRCRELKWRSVLPMFRIRSVAC
jgi:aspartate aminotransferase-like enzyme